MKMKLPGFKAMSTYSAVSTLALTLALADVQAADANKAFEIAAQPLAKALLEYSRQSGTTVVVPDALMAGKRAKPVSGSMSPVAALALMLEGSGLKMMSTEDGGYTLVQTKTATTDGSSKAEDLEEIIVTGSLIRNATPAAQRVVIDRDEIEKRGLSSAEDIVRSLPQNFAGLTRATTTGSGQGSQGTSAADLRGLGAGNTLVLINGRRTAGSATREGGFVNLSTIPADAIERVEVLLDGASAIYGSDAVAGVINFIMRKDYHGAETSVRYENGRNGDSRYSLSQLFGTSWGSGSLTATLSASEERAVNTVKAGWNTLDQRSRGGRDHREFIATSPGTVHDGYVYIYDDGYGNVTPYVFDIYDLIGALPENNDGAGNWSESDLNAERARVLADRSFLDSLDSVSDQKNLSFTFNLNQEITDTVSLYANGLFNKAEHKSSESYGGDFIPVPADNPFNRLGRDVVVLYNFAGEVESGLLPSKDTTSEQERYEVNAGLQMDLPYRDWQLDISGGYSQESSSGQGIALITGFAGAAFADQEARFYELLLSTDPDEAINVFGDGSVQSPFLSELLVPFRPAAPESKQYVFNWRADGELFNAPGGTARLGVGGEYRLERLEYDTDSFIINPDSTAPVASPEQSITALYGQASIPLVGSENSMPGVQALDLTVSARWEEYDIPDAPNGGASYTHTSPGVQLAWQVVDDLRVRMTWSEAFKAPSYAALITDVNVLPFNRTQVDPFAPGGEAIVSVPVFVGGNPDLKPETSDNYAVGFDWTPEYVDGLTLSATWTRIEYTDRITSTGVFTQSLPPEQLLRIPGYATRDASGNLVRLNTIPTNVSERLSENVDVNLKYDFDTDFGTFNAGIAGTLILNLEDKLFEDDTAPLELVETQAGPDRLRLRGTVGWQRENYGVDLFVNYSSSYDLTLRTDTSTSPSQDLGPQRIGHYVTTDLTGHYEWDSHGLRVLAGVRDLFNKAYPFLDSNSGTPWDSTRVNLGGRTMYVEVKKSFEF